MATDTEATASGDRLSSEEGANDMRPGFPTEQIDLALGQHRQLQYEVSRYIETILGELRTIAHAASLKHLQYFIELTRQEAHDQTQRCRQQR